LRDVSKQVQRNREAFSIDPKDMPVYGTMAARFNDDGVSALYKELRTQLADFDLPATPGALPIADTKRSTESVSVLPADRLMTSNLNS